VVEFTGQFLDAIEDKEQLIVGLIQAAYTISPCVGYSDVKPHHDFDKYYDLFAAQKPKTLHESLTETVIEDTLKAATIGISEDKKAAAMKHALGLLEAHGFITKEQAATLNESHEPPHLEPTGLETIIAASESNDPNPNNWIGGPPHFSESVLAQNLPDPPMVATAPHQLVEPPDIPDEILSAIIEWLELSRDQCESPSHWLSLQVVIDVPAISLGYQYTEGDIYPSNSSFDTVSLNYYQVLINRTFVILADSRWFMEVAIRQDTGEPVATVNHSGEFGHWMAQQSNY
jgi:hypothetical protein